MGNNMAYLRLDKPMFDILASTIVKVYGLNGHRCKWEIRPILPNAKEWAAANQANLRLLPNGNFELGVSLSVASADLLRTMCFWHFCNISEFRNGNILGLTRTENPNLYTSGGAFYYVAPPVLTKAAPEAVDFGDKTIPHTLAWWVANWKDYDFYHGYSDDRSVYRHHSKLEERLWVQAKELSDSTYSNAVNVWNNHIKPKDFSKKDA